MVDIAPLRAQVALDFNENSTEPYNDKFTLRELRNALSIFDSSSLGEDSIFYEILKHFLEDSKKFFCK